MSSDYQIIRYKRQKHTFEVLVKPHNYFDFLAGKVTLQDLLFTDVVFSHGVKGEKANVEDLKSEFGDVEYSVFIKEIVDKGEYQISTVERREMVERKKKEIINFIYKYYVDPKTKKTTSIQ